MTFKFCPSNGGFYSDEIHDTIPDDAVEITDELRDALLAGQSAGKRIVMVAGLPAVQDQPAQSHETMMLSIRATRDRYLMVCDWTQLPDTNLSSGAVALWRTYRQALRDLPNGDGFDPASFTWPIPPA